MTAGAVLVAGLHARRCSRQRERRARLGVALILAAAAAPGALTAQVPDSAAIAQQDSARLAVLRRLERLGRTAGADSALFVQDSLRLAEAQAGRRPGTGMDSVATALMSMPGFTLTEYEAASADFAAANRILVLQSEEGGRARVSSEGSLIEADSSITFDESTGSVRAIGDATYTPPEGDPIDAANMVYNLGEGRGSALDARTSFAQDGATWLVRGDMPYAAQDSSFLSHAQFTSCDLSTPHYHFETDQIKIVAGNVLVARGVKLYFADVPVAWLPFMAQSLSRGRASGLLTPRFSVNDIVRTSGGYRRRVSNMGFYWAMGDYSDATVSMDWFSETFFSLTGSFRYQVRRQFLDGDLSYRQFWNQDGSRQQAVDTRHAWELDERTQLRISGRYVSDNNFVRENSFNPQEVTQSIDSEAGINRRFGWGSLSLSSSRRQFLSDDRTEWLLPSANLSLSPITLFRAPSSEAAFYNNMTWSGSGGVTRNSVDRAQSPGDTLSLAGADIEARSAFASSNLSLGSLTFSQSIRLDEDRTLGVPEALLLLGDSADVADLISGSPVRDIAESTLGWSAGVGYQQQLIGSTTITPRLALSGSMFRADQDSLAQNFVSAPSRISFGAQLKTDIYGFFPGFGSFEAVRHKISPAFDYQWSPATTPTSLQQSVFRSRALQPRNTISISLTQTFEAKRREEPGADGTERSGPGAPAPGPEGDPFARSGEQGGRTAAGAGALSTTDDEAGPRRLQQTPSVTLLAWRTSIVEYDFVEADSVGLFLAGFETTRLSNQFSSDYLRGLSISTDHEIFNDQTTSEGRLTGRTFSPHLSQVNLGFSLGSSSSIFRWLGFGGGSGAADEPDDVDPLGFQGPDDESNVVPGAERDDLPGPIPRPAGSGGSGGWTASLSYSLQRPRDPLRVSSQMLSGTLRLQPTPNWSVNWRTAYDLELGAFNDHAIRLSRDLHRWQANFDFLQTATGNWTFRFEVSLLDNRDLKFDYKQRNLDLGLPASQR